jgi:hypothetical protein
MSRFMERAKKADIRKVFAQPPFQKDRAKHGDGDQRIANDQAHHLAVKSRPILTLRPPELSGRDAEHLTEVTRQVALVGKPHGKRNLRQ